MDRRNTDEDEYQGEKRGRRSFRPSSYISEKHLRTCSIRHGYLERRKSQCYEQRGAKKRRSVIPTKPNKSFTLWSIIAQFVGRDLTKISMPVQLCEPLTVLQRLTEDLQYSRLLDNASKTEDEIKQFAYVACFAVSAYCSSMDRDGKPFNPLLGETYECDRTDDLGWRSIAEQVEHHPPISALHCESNSWTLWEDFMLTTKFRGKVIEVKPSGTVHLLLRNSGAHFTWKKVSTNVHNIIVGKTWVEHFGEMEIVNNTSGNKCHLEFESYNFFSRNYQRQVKGTIVDTKGGVLYKLEGSWDTSLKSNNNGSENEVLWTSDPIPANSASMYNFTWMGVQLNEMEEGVAPTDSRFRPDVRLLEIGDWNEASEEKIRLERKQRTTTKSEPPHKPLWFELKKDSVTGEMSYVYKGEYWTSKRTGDWKNCPDLF